MNDHVGDLVVLRRHVEAVWSIAVPALINGDAELAAGVLPPWSLYLAEVQGQRVKIWRSDVTHAARPLLLARGDAALSDLAAAHDGVTCEVVLRQAAVAGTPAVPAQGSPSPSRSRPGGGFARLLSAHDTSLLEEFDPGESAYYLAPERAPVAGVADDGRLVSVAHSSRRTVHACELGVETRPEARGRGFGRAVTTLWTSAVQAEGLLPIYSALASNAPSLALAASAGYRAVARAAQVSAP